VASAVDLERAKVCCADSVKKSARWMRDNGFRDLLWELRKQERDAGICPSDEMGGREGVTGTGVVSCDLGNESHYDSGDNGKSISLWVERRVGTTKDWSLCFPDMKVDYRDKTHRGLRIQLSDGAVVEWDGRRMKHFTTVTDVGKGNMVNGFFFTPSRRIVGPEHQCEWARDPTGK